MKLEKDILGEITDVLRKRWTRRTGYTIPDENSIRNGNDAVEIEGSVLYADLAKSSELVHTYKDEFVARIYKSFLCAVCDVIRNNEGEITAFDGDRVMAVFIGSSKNTCAARTALQIAGIVRCLNNEIGNYFPSTDYRIHFGVGVDTSKLFVVKTGIRKYNDLAWIGDAANIAAKLSNIRGRGASVFITGRVFKAMNDSSRYNSQTEKRSMWSQTQLEMLGQQVYESNWYWNTPNK